MNLLPTRKQWRGWKLPAKLTAIGAYAAVIAIPAMLLFYLFPRDSGPEVVHTTEIKTESSGPFSPAITTLGSNSDVSVSYSFKSDPLAENVPRYEFYFQPTKKPTNADGSKNYEIGFKNLTEQPLVNFQFAVYFREPVESVTYNFSRSTANFTGGDGLSADKTRFHWLGNQIMEDGGWVVFNIKTKHSPAIRRISTKLLGREVQSGGLLPPDPDGLKNKQRQ